jgi:hypothetical protein
MSEEYNDPSANTQAFQAWVDRQSATAQAPSTRSKPLLIAVAVVALIVLAVVIYLLVR